MNLDTMPLTTLAVEAEHHITGPNLSVPRTKGREPVRTVRSPVFIIADAYSGSVEKIHDERGLAFLWDFDHEGRPRFAAADVEAQSRTRRDGVFFHERFNVVSNRSPLAY